MTLRELKMLAVTALVAVMMPIAAQAQWWDRHPGYLKAMSDLRSAYWLISHHETNDPMVNEPERKALVDIRYAYQFLKDAAIRDDRDIDDQPPPDAVRYDFRGRLRRASDLLQDAYDHVDHEEDDPAAVGLRNRALHNIDKAVRSTNQAIRAWNF
jgi:hypothetical protein